jgi:bacteriophage N4 adsorption protein B
MQLHGIVQLLIRGGVSVTATFGFEVLARATHELTLFAATAFLIAGASDAAIDIIWTARSLWRRAFVYRRYARADALSLTPPCAPGRIAIFIPAWDEGEVLEHMLRHTVDALGSADWLVYVGIYPNDPATARAVVAIDDPRVRIVTGQRAGPTTKADCLNSLWQRMLVDEVEEGVRVKAIVLHDAEDVVHPAEVRVFDKLIERFDLVQLPVVPLVDRSSRWVSGHYLDEFATHHSKTLIAREAVGAGLPSAGVGCAFSRMALERLAEGGEGPFDAGSLTEDYELGLRISALGGKAAFVRLPETPGGPPVCVRAHFPATLSAAVTQKSRWIAGIALSGWDRLGWQGGVAESWMRINDRRALFSALVVLTAYVALVLNAAMMVLYGAFGLAGSPPSPLFSALLAMSAFLLVWRLLMRAVLATRIYGWREGLRSIPRAFIGNAIDMMAARRAVGIYLRSRRDGVVRWDKTSHRFPSDPAKAR